MEKHQQHLVDIKGAFPYDTYPQMLPGQEEALTITSEKRGSLTFEAPTGTGKTGVGYTILKAYEKAGLGPLFYTVPTKTLAEQVHLLHPDTKIAYGRSEHPCLYYPSENLKADEIPCSLLRDCVHRVNQETGETHVPGSIPCPYLQQKFEAKQGGIVVCTQAFYLFTTLFSKEFPRPACLIIDEAHGIAEVIRSCLSYEISDYHIARSIKLLIGIAPEEAKILTSFLRKMIRIIKSRPPKRPTLLEDNEIQSLIDELLRIDTNMLWQKIADALEQGRVDAVKDRETLKKVEVLVKSITRYISSLGFSLEEQKRHALNYTYGYYEEEVQNVQEQPQEDAPKKHKNYQLVIRAYYVAPLVQRILGKRTIAYSATIGDPETFTHETGLKAPVYEITSQFPPENARIYLPVNTPNLAVKERFKGEPKRVMRKMVRHCNAFAKDGYRSLVVVVSNLEYQQFISLCKEEGMNVMGYGNGISAREAATRFKVGEGDILVGTEANYAEGLDLPKGIAPLVWDLRPGYPNPTDPGTIFQERRFGRRRWAIWNWRVMIRALQVRGRNIRGTTELGVTFFISQQFRRFLFGSLPLWLQPSYQSQWTLDECVEDARKLLKSRDS